MYINNPTDYGGFFISITDVHGNIYTMEDNAVFTLDAGTLYYYLGKTYFNSFTALSVTRNWYDADGDETTDFA